MSTAEWIGLAAMFARNAILVGVLWGRITTRMDQLEKKVVSLEDTVKNAGYDTHRLEQLETDSARGFKMHAEHYAHEKDPDAHFTKREREDLTAHLQEIEKDLKELLNRNGGPR